MLDKCHRLGDCGDPEGARFRLGELYVSKTAQWELSPKEVTGVLRSHAQSEPEEGNPVDSVYRVRHLEVHVKTNGERDRTIVFGVKLSDLY